MLNLTGTKSRSFVVLVSLTLVVLMLILTWNYGTIQINNMNVVNMYFSLRSEETKNKTSKARANGKTDASMDSEGETAHAIPKRTYNNFHVPSVDEKQSNVHPQNKDLKSDNRLRVNRTMALGVRKDHLRSQNIIDNDSTISSKTKLYDTQIHIINTSIEYVNLTGYHAPDIFDDENQLVFSKVNANISHATQTTSKSECVKRLPDCIIIGVQKCGTKALSEFLKTHPNVSLDSRQTYFFSQNYDNGLDWYRNKMPCSENHQIVLERTPQYFYYKEVPKRIFSMNKQMKLILTVCDPINRAISNYAMAKDRDRERLHDKFEDCILGTDGQINSSCKYVRKSNYQKFMKYWLNVFPLTQIRVVNGTMFRDNPAAALKDVEKFLGIPSYIQKEHFVVNKKTGFKCLRKEKSEKLDCLSRKKGRRHPFVKEPVVLLMNEYFRPRNSKFYSMTGQKFNW